MTMIWFRALRIGTRFVHQWALPLLQHNNNIRKSHSVTCSTAIFYDVENLIGGYGCAQQTIDNLSFQDTLNSIRRKTGSNVVGMDAIQRAIANWNVHRLSVLREEIKELRIECVSVQGRKKNAADHELVIDVMKFLFQRSHLKVFVIVSGDGDFCALADTLHQFDKTVVGCAYPNSTSKDFESICDYFVSLPPVSSEADVRSRNDLAAIPPLRSDDHEYIPTSPPSQNFIPSCVISTIETKKALKRSSLELKSATDASCIHLSQVQESISDAFPGFRPHHFGFTKFVEYMQHCCGHTDLCVARVAPTNAVLALRGQLPPGAQVLPDLKARDVHRASTYRSILSAEGCWLPDSPRELYTIVTWLVRYPSKECSLKVASKDIATGLAGKVSRHHIKLTLSGFVGLGVLIGEPKDARLSKQQLSLRTTLRTHRMVVAALQRTARQRLVCALGAIDDDALIELFCFSLDSKIAASSANEPADRLKIRYDTVAGRASQASNPTASEQVWRHDINSTPTEARFPLEPRNRGMIGKIERFTITAKSLTRLDELSIFAKTDEIMSWYLRDPQCRRDLANSGINISSVKDAICYAIPGFTAALFGLVKFSEFMQYSCRGSEFCVVRMPLRHAALALRQVPPVGAKVLPDVEMK